MARNSYAGNGKGGKMVTCAQTGEEVSRRKSLALDYPGDGKGGSPAAACKRVKRRLAPKKAPLVITSNLEYIHNLQKKVGIKSGERVKVTPKVVKALSTKERVQMKKLIQRKRDEAKKLA